VLAQIKYDMMVTTGDNVDMQNSYVHTAGECVCLVR